MTKKILASILLVLIIATVVWSKMTTAPFWKQDDAIIVLLLNHETIVAGTTEYSPVIQVEGYNENAAGIILATEGTAAPAIQVILEGTPSYEAFTGGKTARESTINWFTIQTLADSSGTDSTSMWNSGGLSTGSNTAILDSLKFNESKYRMDAYRLKIIPGESSPSDGTLTAWVYLKKDD